MLVATLIAGLGACALFATAADILVSPRQYESQVPQPQGRAQSKIQGDQSPLVLPRLTGPVLPPPPPAVKAPQIPPAFQGCWEGDPGEFDWVKTDTGVVAIGAPGKITFCYSDREITVPLAEVRISVGARALDWAMHLALGYRTFVAHGIKTDIYAITPTQMRGRTDLVLINTDHWLYLFSTESKSESQVDWIATDTGAESIKVQAEQVLKTPTGLHLWGGWHAVFHRLI